MNRSRRELSIDMAIHSRDIFKNNQIKLFPSFTFIHKTGVSFPYTWQEDIQCLVERVFFFFIKEKFSKISKVAHYLRRK